MIKASFFFTFFLVACTWFFSCSKGSNTSAVAGELVGTWKLIKTNNTGYFAGSTSFLNGVYTVTYGTDGTGEESQTENGTTFSDTYNFTWAVQGNTLTVVTTSATGTNGLKSSLEGTDSVASITTTTLTILHHNSTSIIADTFMYVRQ